MGVLQSVPQGNGGISSSPGSSSMLGELPYQYDPSGGENNSGGESIRSRANDRRCCHVEKSTVEEPTGIASFLAVLNLVPTSTCLGFPHRLRALPSEDTQNSEVGNLPFRELAAQISSVREAFAVGMQLSMHSECHLNLFEKRIGGS